MPIQENTPNVEARETKRFELISDLTVVYEGDGKSLPVHPPDLTPQGMFINTSERFPVGAVLKLHFRLVHSGHELNLRAEVRHCVPGVGVGVEFVGLSTEHQQAIEEEMRMEYPLLSQRG